MELLKTDDGTYTLKNSLFNETYHSRRGAWLEKKYVFIEQGLNQVLKDKELLKKNSSLIILEVGLGTGMNVLLSLNEVLPKQDEELKSKRVVYYEALEPFPLKLEWVRKLKLEKKLNHFLLKVLEKIHQFHLEEGIFFTPHFHFKKRLITLEKFKISLGYYDLIYFDPFSLKSQPELWNLAIFKKLKSSLKKKGLLVSYASNHTFKKNLKEAGFTYQVLPGALGKKEMIRAEA